MSTPDGTLRAISGANDKTLRVWDPIAGPRAPQQGTRDSVYGVAAFTPPDDAARPLRLVRPYGARVGPHRRHRAPHARRHTGTLWSVAAFTLPDGTPRALSGATDNTVRVWDPIAGKALHTLEGHTKLVRGVAALTLPDGTPLLLSGSDDSTVRVWGLPESALQPLRARRRASRRLVAHSNDADNGTGARLLDRVLATGEGVPWLHARLMVRGVGAAGKSSIINAMRGMDFDDHQKSTVGAGVADVELHQSALQLGGEGKALTSYQTDEPSTLSPWRPTPPRLRMARREVRILVSTRPCSTM